MKKFEGISEEGSVKTESFFSQELDLFFWPLSVLTWTSVSLHWNAFEVVERSNGKDLFLLSTLYKDIRNYWNLLVTDTEFLLEVEPTSLLYCMVFIGSEMLFTLHFTVFWQLVKIGELVFDDLKTFIFEFGTFIRFFFRILVQVGVTIVLFTKIFADDVDIVFVLPVTICWGECKQAESQLCFKDTGWDILVKKTCYIFTNRLFRTNNWFLNKIAVEPVFYINFTFFVWVCKCCKTFSFSTFDVKLN